MTKILLMRKLLYSLVRVPSFSLSVFLPFLHCPYLTVSFYKDMVHDEFIGRLHDNFKKTYGLEIANIRVEAFKIMNSELADNISKQAIITAQVLFLSLILFSPSFLTLQITDRESTSEFGGSKTDRHSGDGERLSSCNDQSSSCIETTCHRSTSEEHRSCQWCSVEGSSCQDCCTRYTFLFDFSSLFS